MTQKEINALKEKRAAKIKEITDLNNEAMAEARSLNEDEQTKYDTIKREIETLGEDIKRGEELQKLNAEIAGMNLRNENDGTEKAAQKDFLGAAREYIKTNGRSISNDFMGREGGLLIPQELRANPLITSSVSNGQNKVVRNDLDMVTGDNFTLLSALGVQFFTGLNGVTYLPYMAQLSASKPNEQIDVSTANAAPATVDLTPQAYGSYQQWTKQMLLTSPDSLYTGIIQDMQLANERKVVTDLFAELLTTDVSIATTVAGLTYGDMINLTNIDYNIGSTAFVTDNDIRVYLEQKAVNSTGIALSWNALNNTVGGRRAISSDAMAAKRAVYGNFSHAAVGEWGTPELIVNPYDGDTAGKLKVTVLGFYDVACRNKWAFKHFAADASVGV